MPHPDHKKVIEYSNASGSGYWLVFWLALALGLRFWLRGFLGFSKLRKGDDVRLNSPHVGMHEPPKILHIYIYIYVVKLIYIYNNIYI